ncbi:MAG: NAD-dependent epimerase/dehydratase family protein [Cytophagales bacterium]|nr:NAD-dependent epimerase/dehydratase family protein [Cytophagales bacterium]
MHNAGKKAIIAGHTGQDGSYLYKYLHEKGCNIIGIASKSIDTTHHQPGLSKHINIVERESVYKLIDNYQPDEIYYLAAVHQSSIDIQYDESELFKKSIEINLIALINFLEGIKKYSKSTRLFYAASSHIFGNPTESPQNELTPFRPNCIYGITKTAGVNTCHFYRTNYGIMASIGIFYNHESPIRSSKFVSKKIVETAVAIKNKTQHHLVIGDLNAKIDWGYALDYVKAMHKILQLNIADDFIISSGSIHTVGDFVRGVFGYLGLDWSEYVKEDPNLITKKPKKNLYGNNQKLKTMTGWDNTVSFNELIEIMVDAELKKVGSLAPLDK